jgi:hypothetical protein
VLISPACLIGLIERNEALFAFAKGRGASSMTITCANPEMYEAVARSLRDQFPAHQAQQKRPF